MINSDDDLRFRIKRIFAAVDSVIETDISKCMPKVIKDGRRIGIYQDWSHGLSNAEISNIAHMLIYNVANLKDHLKKWAERNGKEKNKVYAAFKSSEVLKIVKDLSNNDRHGYDPKKRGNSGKSPRVDKINTVMQMTTMPKKGSFVSLTLNRQGVPKIAGSGTAKVIITGDIIDKDGNRIGDLYKTLLEACQVWEKVLGDFGVKV